VRGGLGGFRGTVLNLRSGPSLMLERTKFFRVFPQIREQVMPLLATSLIGREGAGNSFLNFLYLFTFAVSLSPDSLKFGRSSGFTAAIRFPPPARPAAHHMISVTGSVGVTSTSMLRMTSVNKYAASSPIVIPTALSRRPCPTTSPNIRRGAYEEEPFRPTSNTQTYESPHPDLLGTSFLSCQLIIPETLLATLPSTELGGSP